MVLGIVGQAAGLLVMAQLWMRGLVVAMAGSVIWAVGQVLADVSITITATSGWDEADKGLGAGLVITSQEVGRALGLGVLTAVVTARPGALAGTRGALDALVEGLRWGSARRGGLPRRPRRPRGHPGRAQAAPSGTGTTSTGIRRAVQELLTSSLP
jgi:hypothetical protein